MKNDIINAFSSALAETVEGMSGMEVGAAEEREGLNEFEVSEGVTCIVGFSGRIKGRALLWCPGHLAKQMTEFLMDETPGGFQEESVLFTVAEINNVLSGQAVTVLNNTHGLSLRLSPPSMFAGESYFLSTPKLPSYQLVLPAEDDNVYLFVSIEGGLGDE